VYRKKKFNKRDYKKSDQKSKQKSFEFLNSFFGCRKCNNSNESELYSDGDIIVETQSGKNVLIECEHKIVWEKSGRWEKWDTVDIPYRKSKNKSEILLMFNKHFNTVVLIPFFSIKSSEQYIKKTKFSKSEKFYKIDVCNCNFFYCEDCLGWTHIDRYGEIIIEDFEDYLNINKKIKNKILN
jgi:hypothetical protein